MSLMCHLELQEYLRSFVGEGLLDWAIGIVRSGSLLRIFEYNVIFLSNQYLVIYNIQDTLAFVKINYKKLSIKLMLLSIFLEGLCSNCLLIS